MPCLAAASPAGGALRQACEPRAAQARLWVRIRSDVDKKIGTHEGWKH